MFFSLQYLVNVPDYSYTVSLLLTLFPALLLKITVLPSFHPLLPFITHIFRPLFLLEDFFRAFVLHGMKIVESLFRNPVISYALIERGHYFAFQRRRDVKQVVLRPELVGNFIEQRLPFVCIKAIVGKRCFIILSGKRSRIITDIIERDHMA